MTATETLGEENLLLKTRDLHIEMNFVKLIGYWLTGSGRKTALPQAEVTTSGHAYAILISSHLNRSYYAHQVSTASLDILQRAANDTNANCHLEPLI